MEEIIVKDILSSPSKNHWEKIGIKKHKGVIIPLFSLKTRNSSGIGEYLDLLMVIDFLKDVGFNILQLLPLNETSTDFSPYNAISSCALNPIHLSLSKLKGVNENIKLKEKLKGFDIYNKYSRVNYTQVKRLKMAFLEEYYNFIFEDLKKDKDYEEFLISHPWLEEYALFRSIQKKENFKHWELWDEKYKNIINLPSLIQEFQNEMKFYYSIQYLCFSQLSEVKKYADEKNILIQGDIPILISKNSCDVWFNRQVFNDNLVAGAPPDRVNLYGQKWGFPLYNWEYLKKTDYKFWKKRLSAIENIYHMYRIDHAVGFFRIWAIKPDKDPMEGEFIPRDPLIWDRDGNERLLMLLNASKLFPIAEDLGLIPEVVYKTLKKLCIPGIKVIPWEKNIFGIIKFNQYEPISVTTVSTHDSDTLQQWWEGVPKEANKFAAFKNWSFERFLTYSQRKEFLKDSVNTSSIFHINLFQEYLALYPELVNQDFEDERINIPGTILPTNWTYKFKPYFEEIINHTKFKNDLIEILTT
ncbi:MAG: 4-alpha-glucanotransferase [Chlamydiae bacterium RIFCSPHIGHO2_12_FULL_27_8]|nr:MAG: 4-alpha-glucanotransferase [Chlamydiae bacterium RIFCSPHIGHO2_12_FULL_27_8]